MKRIKPIALTINWVVGFVIDYVIAFSKIAFGLLLIIAMLSKCVEMSKQNVNQPIVNSTTIIPK